MKYSKWQFLPFVLCLCAMIACTRSQHYDVDRVSYPVKGIDLSAHNGRVDFNRVAADTVSFVYIKASEGTDFCDAMFNRNYEGAKAAGLKVGAYHFFRFDEPGHLQAYQLLNTVSGKEFDMPLVIDVEDWHNAGEIPDEDVIDGLHAMINVVESSGAKVMIYTNKNGYERFVQPSLHDKQLWICSLSSQPDEYGWRMWQHSHKGTVDGVNGDVDIDTFNGTVQDFEKWCLSQ